MSKILTSHVGSLLRSQEVVDFIFARENGTDYDLAAFDIVGHDRVIARSDCGFATFAGCGAVDPEIAYAKRSALAAGAAQIT